MLEARRSEHNVQNILAAIGFITDKSQHSGIFALGHFNLGPQKQLSESAKLAITQCQPQRRVFPAIDVDNILSNEFFNEETGILEKQNK